MDNKKDFAENMNRLAKVKTKELAEIKKDDLFSRSIVELDEKSNKEDGVEFWYARELQKILGYASWGKFLNVINIPLGNYGRKPVEEKNPKTCFSVSMLR